MTKNLLFLVWMLIFCSAQVYSQETPKVTDDGVVNSYDYIVLKDQIVVEGDNLSEASVFHYSLNNGSYLKFDKQTLINSNSLVLEVGQLTLDRASNQLEIWYNSKDLIKSIVINYSKPAVNIQSVFQSELKVDSAGTSGHIFVVKRQLPVTVNFKKYSMSLNEPSVGIQAIKKVQYKLGANPDWIDVKNAGSIATGALVPGENFIYFRAEGEVLPTLLGFPPEYSDIVKVTIFYIDFSLPEIFDSSGNVWKRDSLIKLSGLPDGGWFTGTGIVGGSNYFNSSVSAGGSGKIKYNFPYSGIIVTNEKPIQVLLYDFEISGSLSVSRNSSDVGYQIKNSSNDFSYFWAIKNGTPESINSSSVNKVTWNRNLTDDQHFGEVAVTATHKNSGARFYRTISVFINNNIAYDKPALFFGDQDQKMVICSITDAYVYKWYSDGVKVDSSSLPYHYYKTPGKIYAVELVTPEGAVTRQEIYRSTTLGINGGVREGKTDNLNSGSLPKRMVIYPNVTKDELNLVFTEPDVSSRIRIFNSASQLLFETQIGKGIAATKINTSKYPPGKYFVKLINSSGSQSDQFVKIN